MAASRVVLLRASWCRASSYLPALSSRPSLCAVPRTLRCLPPSPLLRRPSPYLLRLYSFATAAAAEPKEASSASSLAGESHPWPEWVAFLVRLRCKGYFDGPAGAITDGEAADGSEELNRIKFACLSFARDRFDILRSLSKKDIKAVVGHGCPNLFRKPVHSAKRLRAFVKLDEGEVCSSCNLRGSCDRAYLNAEEEARTVDVVRILLNYAADPLLLSGDKSHEKAEIEASARRLLAELTEMCNMPVDPSLPKSAVKPPRQHERQKSKIKQDNVEMKRGDWICSTCNFMNFARNLRCLECKEEGPRNVDFDSSQMKKGDWPCPECNFMNFSRNTTCKRCKRCQEPRPKGEGDLEMEVKMKLGDWVCPECQFMNFARNANCRRCKKERQRQLNPGEWECPSCDFLNFRRNTSCLRCNAERPEVIGFAEQIWKRPDVRMISRDEDDQSNEDDDGYEIDEDKDDHDYDGSSDSKLEKGFTKFMPIREGENKHITSKRRSPSERRRTSGRNRTYV